MHDGTVRGNRYLPYCGAGHQPTPADGRSAFYGSAPALALGRGRDDADGKEHRPLDVVQARRGKRSSERLRVDASFHQRGDLLAQQDG